MLFRYALLLLAAHYASSEPVQVLSVNFPDPCVIQTDQGYYAFSTQGQTHIQVARSDDFSSWEFLDGVDALPNLPSWVKGGGDPGVWAPDVIRRDDGTYVMYYCAAATDDGTHCVGVATSSTIEGPYTPREDTLACPTDQGGAIDASGFQDGDGTRYIVYKVDGNRLNSDGTTHPTPIMLQKLASDAVTADGDPIQLLDRDDGDGPLIEAPSLLKVDGTYYLSFSSNMYDTLLYDASFATASAVSGPYTKARAPNAPLLVTGDASNVGALGGPGGADFSEDGTRMVFHAFLDGQTVQSGRGMWVVDIQVGDGVITLQ